MEPQLKIGSLLLVGACLFATQTMSASAATDVQKKYPVELEFMQKTENSGLAHPVSHVQVYIWETAKWKPRDPDSTYYQKYIKGEKSGTATILTEMLPSGKYDIEAHFGEHKLEKNITVGPDERNPVIFEFEQT